MPDDHRDPDGVPPGGDGYPGMPGWMKAAAVAGALAAAAVLVALLAGGDHGPGRHGLPPAAPVTGVTVAAVT